MAKKKDGESKKRGTPTREILYNEAAKWTPKAIDKAVYLMDHGDNDSVKLGAIKLILSKSLPDLHVTEINGSITTININRDYVSPRGWTVPTPTRSLEGSDKVQGANLAQES